MDYLWLFVTHEGKFLKVNKDDPCWGSHLSLMEKFSLRDDNAVTLKINGKTVECILLKQGHASELQKKEESLLKNASLSPMKLYSQTPKSSGVTTEGLTETPIEVSTLESSVVLHTNLETPIASTQQKDHNQSKKMKLPKLPRVS